MHAALISVSPLTDLQSIFTSGKTTAVTTPAAVQSAINSQGTPEPSALANNPNTAATIASLANSLAAGSGMVHN